MKFFYTDQFVLPLPAGHRFPMAKYRLLRERVAAQLVPPGELRTPCAASDEQLLLAHRRDYVTRVARGELTPAEIRRIGFPWSPEMVERSRRSSGATIEACRAALADGYAANLAGGTHHAFADAGEGYCVFNDAAIAARVMQAEGLVKRVVILDCDVHQGNGTAAITQGDPTIFTFSIHGAKNFPLRKVASDYDVPLPDGIDDAGYLYLLERGIRHAVTAARADLAIYLAGADPYRGDRLGRLAVSKRGLAQRDRIVFDACQHANLPVAITMAGGYAENVADIVDIHFTTLRVALERMG